jgi:hypothetical protein
MSPHYYLMKNKKILRLESDMRFNDLTIEIQTRLFDHTSEFSMNQEQANWRVVLFRDEIMELDEYQEWLQSPEALIDEDLEFELIAN